MPRNSYTPSVDSRSLDIAKGVLVALRGCTSDEAFAEITGISKQRRLGTLALARALVQLAEGSVALAAGPAAEAAMQTWGHLLRGSRSSASLA
ncbi:ANTAR domain-containing protein [Mycolicibacterium mengxianglii]|uniref:ANTAR domain-containing protein n=1 Tax=Mycolicibacterium mengxianglii TaxID=2736649 RepID=UPI0018EEDDB4|nr:ANTAR domain-containing protein [Mycolicibacterium mengxianglii]